MGIGFPTHSSGVQAPFPNVDHLSTKGPRTTFSVAAVNGIGVVGHALDTVSLKTKPTLCTDFCPALSSKLLT